MRVPRFVLPATNPAKVALLPTACGQQSFKSQVTDIDFCHLICQTLLMNETTLTRERILQAAEEVIRRFGPGKATVVDVARALGVSHGSVYRHFASKAELRDAVARKWLARVNAPLQAILAENAPADKRLYRWLRELMAIKRRLLFEEPELFATYCALGAEARDVVREHVVHLAGQISRIIEQGVARGELACQDTAAIGRAVLSATVRFHNPAHSVEWSDPNIDSAFEEVWSLILSGLLPRAREKRKREITE